LLFRTGDGDTNSKDASVKLAAKYRAMNKAREEEARRRQRDLQDQQELEKGLATVAALTLLTWLIGKAKVRKMVEANNYKEDLKKEKIQSMALKKLYRQQEKERFMFDRLGESEQKHIFQEMNEREKAHIAEIKEHKHMQQLSEEMAAKERQEMEMVRLKMLKDSREHEEIIRRLIEENAMRKCEESRRKIEDRLAYNAWVKQQGLTGKRDAVHTKIDTMTGRVRMGNFAWHHGKYSFYDDVRPKAVEWYQYEDASGLPYYFDRITNKTQYRMPTDAPIRHWTDDLRDAYDAEHGAGAYDAMLADQAFRRSVNEQGGWWDENGEWVVATGYYGDDGEWYVEALTAFIQGAKIS
jgi:hypothetical protein